MIPEKLTHSRALARAIQAATDALDAAHRDGLPIAPVASMGAANLGVALAVLVGAEAARHGQQLDAGDVAMSAVTPPPTTTPPAHFTRPALAAARSPLGLRE